MDPFEEAADKWKQEFQKLKNKKLDQDAIKRGKIVSDANDLLNGKVPSTEDALNAGTRIALEAKQSILREAYPNNPMCSCGCVMVERRNKSTGDTFWGCSNYPKCTETLRKRKRY